MSKTLFWAVVVLAVLALAALLLAGQSVDDWEKQLKTKPDDPTLLIQLGRAYHDQAGLEGRADAVEKAEQLLTRLLALEPENAAALVYLGSIQTIKARDSAPSMESLEFLNRGFSLMDKAVLLAPENPEIRFVRGVNSALIPSEFGRGDLALEDFQAIERLLAGASDDLDPRYTLTYSFYYGKLLAERGETAAAAPLLKKVIELAPGSPLAAQAKMILEGKRLP